MKIINKKIFELIPYANNSRKHSRKHSRKQIKQIASSICEFGFNVPVLIDKKNGIIAGHGRVLAAELLNMKEVPTIEISHLTKAQKKAFIIADNKIADNAEWDESLLKLELEFLKEDNFDVDLMGFDDDELNDLFPKKKLTDEDSIPEVKDLICKMGDLWQLGNHRLLCGDSTKSEDVERLMNGEKADMVFTDPPYGVDYQGGHFHSGDVNIKRKREKLKADNSTIIYNEFLKKIIPVVEGPCYMFFADNKGRDVYNAVFEVGCEIHALIIWHKTNATYAAMNAQYKQRHEPCLYFKPKGKTLRWCGASTENTLWEIKTDGRNNFHPTQKPIALAEKAIRNHKIKNILDPFLGSGSTLIAAEKTNRKCYGIEIDSHYCDVIISRWQNFTGEKAIKI